MAGCYLVPEFMELAAVVFALFLFVVARPVSIMLAMLGSKTSEKIRAIAS
jgi:NhaP-type Na+/H+ and K+/H+ antiporter